LVRSLCEGFGMACRTPDRGSRLQPQHALSDLPLIAILTSSCIARGEYCLASASISRSVFCQTVRHLWMKLPLGVTSIVFDPIALRPFIL
jgi:hypothetical protein